PGLVAEHAVLPERRLQQQAVAVAVLGDVADAGLAAAQRGPGGDVVAVEAEAAARLADAHDGLDELGLAVALDARDADDLALADLERDLVQQAPPALGFYGQAGHLEHDGVGHRGLAGLGGGQFAADHELGELAGGGAGGVDAGHRGAAPDHGDRVGDAEHLVELARDEDDGEAAGLELAQVLEELVDLLRDEHGGRLVEDE